MLMLHDFRVRQRDFLLEISRAITAQLDLSEVLRLVLNASVVMLSGEVGLIALREGAGHYRIRATMGVDGDRIHILNEQLADLMTGVKEGLDSELLNEKMRQMALALDVRLKQSIALPLVIAGEPLGLLIVFRSYRGSASADDVQVLQSFADQAAVAVHNAQLYAAVEQERRRLSAILEHSADGVMILDSHLHILSMNHALARMTAWRTEDAVGLPQEEVIQWDRRDVGDLEGAIAEGWPLYQPDSEEPADAERKTLYVEGDLRRRDGLILSVGITYAPLVSQGGKLINIIANVRDITNFRKAQEMQNMFVSTVSHELRTPIALIKGYAGTLRRDDVAWDPDVLRDSLTVIEDEADRLNALVDNLLTASKLQSQRQLDIHLADARIPVLAARSVERFATQTDKHHLELNFPADFPVVQADEVRIRQVIDNLVSNAIKYSPDEGAIEVGGTVAHDSITVYVRDEGIGMNEQQRERLFERFYRVDNMLSRKTQGTGLGLYLSRAIVEAHGGRIDVDSQPGQGSTFYFQLPR